MVLGHTTGTLHFCSRASFCSGGLEHVTQLERVIPIVADLFRQWQTLCFPKHTYIYIYIYILYDYHFERAAGTQHRSAAGTLVLLSCQIPALWQNGSAQLHIKETLPGSKCVVILVGKDIEQDAVCCQWQFEPYSYCRLPLHAGMLFPNSCGLKLHQSRSFLFTCVSCINKRM